MSKNRCFITRNLGIPIKKPRGIFQKEKKKPQRASRSFTVVIKVVGLALVLIFLVELFYFTLYNFTVTEFVIDFSVSVMVLFIVVFYLFVKMKALEMNLVEAAEEWKSTFDSISDMVSVQDKDFRIIRMNKAYVNVVSEIRALPL